MKLFRPVGVHGLRLIAEADWRAFPPRLEGQPIFYPVLDEDYAVQIARDWNRDDDASGYAGFVTAFDVEDTFVTRYKVEIAGGSRHRELWVPAEDLEEFNRHIVGSIVVIRSFYGGRFTDPVDPESQLPSGL